MPLPLSLEWIGDAATGHLRLLDQTVLPARIAWIECRDVPTLFDAIRRLSVRGAPAIGCAAAYGVILGMQRIDAGDDSAWSDALCATTDQLARSRPTAVNLFWALDRMRLFGQSLLTSAPPMGRLEALLAEAHRIRTEDAAMCRAIGRHGAELLEGVSGVLTHCNAGALAVSEYGTALAPIYTLHERGQTIHVYADETRPLLQGARLTAWELQQAGVPVTVICDNMAAVVMRERRVGAVIVGADRIAANGDAANKIGTYTTAILAKHHGIPFYVAAPSSTFDLTLPSGDGIPIEQRDPREITHGFGRQTVPAGVDVFNPAFDVTPAELITAIITERGVFRPVNAENVKRVLGG